MTDFVGSIVEFGTLSYSIQHGKPLESLHFDYLNFRKNIFFYFL